MAHSRPLLWVLLFALAGCSPQLPSFDNRPAISIPNDLGRYLAESEKKVPNLKPGTEKTIRWAHGVGRKTPYSIVYFHGFSASRQEISPVVERVADAIGANVFFTRFTGHGVRGVDALAAARAEDWIRDSWEAMEIGRKIGGKVIVMGMSMGAVPAVQMAIRNDDVFAVALFAPLLSWNHFVTRLAVSPIGPLILHLRFGKTRSFKPVNEKQEYFWTTTYRVEALEQLMKMAEIQNETDFGLLNKRVLLFYSRKDEFLDPDQLEVRFRQIGSGIKRLVHLDAATRHEITGGIVAPQTVDVSVAETVRFLKEAGMPGAKLH